MRWMGLVVCVVALGLVGLGCGDGDEADGSSRKAFVDQVNAVCVKSNKKATREIVKAYERADVRTANTEKEAIRLEVAIFVPVLLEAAKAQVRAIEGLEAPSGDEAEIEDIVGAYETWIDEAEGAPFQVVIANDVYNDARRLAGKYGLAKCAISAFENP